MNLERSVKAPSVLVRAMRAGLAGLATVAAIAGTSAGCLDRPVSPATPNTTNVFVQDVQRTAVDKIDLLFMIDNSISMADKQEILGQAVPQLVGRLVQPKTDSSGQLEFQPVVDIHIGVISSSIGGHGGDQCSENGPGANPTQRDMSHLIPSVRQNLQSYQNMGFLWWDPTGKKANPPGEANAGNLISQFQAWLAPGGVGENGCGYEASLESWYRFLVDPAPYQTVTVNNNVAELQGVDDVVLQQRKDFLRQDSLVAIMMLSDENDCSIVDGGFNWIAAQTTNPNNTAYQLPRATVACDNDPNDPCCQSCASSAANTGCPALASDANCQQGLWDAVGDHPNLRCWQEKRRFGINFLYPTKRYVEALTQQKICPTWDGGGPTCDPNDPNARVPNPLFNNSPDGSGSSRDPNLIYVAGLVGVPWQDIATHDATNNDDTLNDPNNLRYLKAAQIAAEDRWKWLVPNCKSPASGPCDVWDEKDSPDDPLMIESTAPRSGNNPATNDALVDPSGAELANPINGHEWITGQSDLEYACIFKLGTPKDCATATGGCDCKDVGTGYTANSPLCEQGTTYSKQQIYAKAYPGLRELEVLKDFGNNSIVASICPKITTGDPTADGYGYNPAVNAIIDRLKEVLAGQCINRPVDIKIDPATQKPIVQCSIVEVLQSGGNGCACDPAKNRFDLSGDTAKLIQPVLQRLKLKGKCGPDSVGNIPCDTATWCMCGINYASDVVDCQNSATANPANFGWCYIDAAKQQASPPAAPGPDTYNPDLVAKCNPHRQLRFVGDNTPANGSTVFIACLGAPVVEATDAGP